WRCGTRTRACTCRSRTKADSPTAPTAAPTSSWSTEPGARRRRRMPRPLTVLQLLPALESGGVERSTLEVSAALVAAGHRALVASAGGRMLPALLESGAEHVALDIGRKSLATLRLVRPLRQLMAEQGVDIVHARSRLPRAARPARRVAAAPGHHGPRPQFAFALQPGDGPRRTRHLRISHRARTPAAALPGDRSRPAARDPARHRSGGLPARTAAGGGGAGGGGRGAPAARWRGSAAADAGSRHPAQGPRGRARPACRPARRWPRRQAVDARRPRPRARGLRRRA